MPPPRRLPARAGNPTPAQCRAEELGSGRRASAAPRPGAAAPVSPRAAGGEEVLLIPDSTGDKVDMFDPQDGTFLGTLISGAGLFSTPINAVEGPDGNLYVSDQANDAVYVFDVYGNPLSTYADASDGLNNVRGIAFRNDHLFVTSGDGYVAEFDGPHSRLPDFINDGSEPFDIFFLPDQGALVSDIQGSADNVRRYDAGGAFLGELFKVNFPEQVREDPLQPGDYLVASYYDAEVRDFDLDGTVQQTTPLPAYGRGVFRLGNGNLLVSTSTGVYEIKPGTGAVVDQEASGSYRFIELVELSKDPFYPDVWSIDSATGGQVHFTLNGGPANANRHYLILAGLHGETPGTQLPGGLTVPVTWDAFTNLELSLLNSPVFLNFKGNGPGSTGEMNPGPGIRRLGCLPTCLPTRTGAGPGIPCDAAVCPPGAAPIVPKRRSR